MWDFGGSALKHPGSAWIAEGGMKVTVKVNLSGLRRCLRLEAATINVELRLNTVVCKTIKSGHQLQVGHLPPGVSPLRVGSTPNGSDPQRDGYSKSPSRRHSSCSNHVVSLSSSDLSLLLASLRSRFQICSYESIMPRSSAPCSIPCSVVCDLPES